MLNEIDRISGKLIVYLNPEYFKPEFLVKFKKGEAFDRQKVERYYELISTIGWFLRKISRYQVFFLFFYPSNTDNIKWHEALEHHVDAYLEDLETIKNKLSNYVCSLKNDLKKIAQNKDEITSALEWLDKQVYIAFKKTSDIRGSHRHKGYRFVDNYIIDGEIATAALNERFPFRNQFTEYAINKLQKQEKESFENGTKHWSENAANNYKQVLGLAEEVFRKTKGFLYRLLDVSSVDINETE